MHGNLHGGFGHARRCCDLGNRLPVDLHAPDQPLRSLRQGVKHGIEVVAVISRLRGDSIIGDKVRDVINRQMFALSRPAQQVDQLVTRNGIHPGRQDLIGIIGDTARMDGQESLLHQVLRLA